MMQRTGQGNSRIAGRSVLFSRVPFSLQSSKTKVIFTLDTDVYCKSESRSGTNRMFG